MPFFTNNLVRESVVNKHLNGQTVRFLSIQFKLFVTQFKYQTIIFLSIQFNMSYFCIVFNCQINLFKPLVGLFQVLPLWVRVNQGTMAMKRYCTLPKDPRLLNHHYHMARRYVQDSLYGFLLLYREAFSLFYSPNQLNWNQNMWGKECVADVKKN